MPPPLVGIGHSMGGNTIMNLALLHPALFTTLVLSEATLKRIPAGRFRSSLSAAYGATFRKDVWPSRAEATKAMSKNRFFSSLDPRVTDLFMQYGLRELPTPMYPDISSTSTTKPVTLTTTRHQEALGIARGAYPKPGQPLSSFVPQRSTHLELATGATHRREVAFYRPESYLTYEQLPNLQPTCLYIFASNAPEDPSVRDDITSHTGIGVCGNGGLKTGGTQNVLVDGAGHFVPFEKPKEVAELCAAWMGKALASWRRKDEEEERVWRSRSVADKTSVDEEYIFWMRDQFDRKTAPPAKTADATTPSSKL